MLRVNNRILNKYINPPSNTLSIYIYKIFFIVYLIFTYLKAISTIISTDTNSTIILLIEVNSNSDDIPPNREETIILVIFVFLLSNILTEVIIIPSIITLNKKNKSIYIFIY